MYATEWSKKEYSYSPSYKGEGKKEINHINNLVSLAAPIVWGEHCVECAVPQCYGVCEHYKLREDNKCKLLANGILQRKDYPGLLGYGVEIIFQGWAKIEARCNIGQISLTSIKRLDKIFDISNKTSLMISRKILKKFKTWSLTTLNYKIREGISLIKGRNSKRPDAFLIEIINNEDCINLIIEVKTNTKIKYRNSLEIGKGYNQKVIPIDEFNITSDEEHKILIYPENVDKPRTLVFCALDFVTFKIDSEVKENSFQATPSMDLVNENLDENVSKKIKCVIWDLDNTLWSGVLVEDKSVKLNNDVVKVIKELDKRGIISSVVSKNDNDEAMEKLNEFGLTDYIVMPRINWNPKSINIKQIIEDINIGMDTVAFVDDSPFERAEVSEIYPEILCIDAIDYSKILSMSRFDVLVSAESSNRRLTYKMLEKQKQELETWNGDIDSFLKSCKMVLTLGKPYESELERCFELLQRTNQLNSSGRRLSMDEIMHIYNDPDYETYVLVCKDRFGEYGIVGFSIVKLEESPIITDFVISCRVAKKKVEHSYILYLAQKYKKHGYKALYMNYRKTVKNGPIFQIVKDLNMKNVGATEENEKYEIQLSGDIETLEIITVVER